MNRLTKFTHFLPIYERFSPHKLAKLFISYKVSLYGVPMSIVSDKDP